MNYRNKVAVITGASRGLGAGVAASLAQAGLRLALCARSEPPVPDGSDAVTGSVDVTDPAAVAAFADDVERRFGAIDLWINNAGLLGPVAPLRDIGPDDFRQVLDVNVMGVVNGTRAYIRHRRAHDGGGVLINISSGAAQHSYAGWSAYCASKAAVDRLSEAVQLEEADTGLRVHAVAPGVVDTDMQARIRSTPPEHFPMVERFLQLKESGHFNTPAFVARELLAVAFDPERRPPQVVVRLGNEWEQ